MHPHEVHEIAILGQHDRTGCPGGEEDLRIVLITQPQILQGRRLDVQRMREPMSQRLGRIGRQPKSSRREDWVIEPAAREAKAGRDVLRLQIRQLFQNLFG